MLEKHYTFSQVFDIYGVRVLGADKNACYAALDVLHELYKSGGALDLAEAQRETHRWLQSLLEIQSESRDSKEFLEHIKGDLFPEEIYVFTPKGKIMALPRGATAVDFAYGVHTDIGHHCVAARINYELLPLRTELKNGDHVEILTSPTARPNPSWLSFVSTGKARSRIRHYLKGLQQKESAALGERLLNQALATLKVEPEAISWDRWEALAKEYGTKSHLDILADIGLGKRLSFVVAQALTRSHGKADELAPPTKPGALTLRGVEGVAIQYARCCRPIPGDTIVGQFRKGQGLIDHLRECVTLRKQRVDSGELIDVEWSPDVQGVFDAGVRVLVADRRGLLADLATSIGSADANIDTVSMERPDGGEVLAMFFSVQVRDRRHLAQVMRAMRHVPDVKRVH